MLCVDALMNKSIENYNSRHDLDTVQNVILYIYIYIYIYSRGQNYWHPW